jgi:bifunctional DNase/RNase
VIVLKEKEGNRFLPVIIGIAEVNSIKLKLSGIKPPRPLTHDLLMSVIESLGAKLSRVLIDRLQNNTFYAKLCLAVDSKEILIDARPSDSVALALRAGVPIFVEEEVLKEAGVSEF